jgi:lysophospholipase L1-like esterase
MRRNKIAKSIFERLRDRGLCMLFALSMAALFGTYYTKLASPFFLNLGGGSDERYVRNFYSPEQGQGLAYRWTKDSSYILVPDLGHIPVRIEIGADGARPEGEFPPKVALIANGERVADFVITNGISVYQSDYLPASLLFPGDLLLEIKSETFVPSADSRNLGILVNTVTVRPLVAPLSPQLLLVCLTATLTGAFFVSFSYLLLRHLGISQQKTFSLCLLMLIVLAFTLVKQSIAIRTVLICLGPLIFSYAVMVFGAKYEPLQSRSELLEATLGRWSRNVVLVLRNPFIILSLCSLCISLLLAEFSMRLIYRPTLELGEITPWVSPKYTNYTPEQNQFGFREEELSDAIIEDGFTRILFLGDSVTFGFGVEKGEERFSDLIESRLNSAEEQKGSKSKYHIYNAGVPGTSPKDWLAYLDRLIPVYKPDYVFVIFFLRDGTSLRTSLRFWEGLINEIKAKYTGRFLYRYSYIGRYIYDRLILKEFSDYYTEEIISAYIGEEDDKRTWIDQQLLLLEMRDLCKKNKIEFHLIIFPLLYDLDSSYPFYKVEDEIVRFADSGDIPVFSLTKGFIGQADHTLWISPSDQHPNERGHQIAADTLYPYLKEVIDH